jgi:hypothetical protein
MACREQTFISRGWKSEIREKAQTGSGDGPFYGCRLLTLCPPLAEREPESSLGLLCKVTHLLHEGPTLITSSSPKGLTPNSMPLTVWVSTCEFQKNASLDHCNPLLGREQMPKERGSDAWGSAEEGGEP